MQAVLAAFTDFYTYKLAEKVFGKASGRWALFCQALSWFVFFSAPRTLSNNVEALLTVAAFYHYPYSPQALSHRPSETRRHWVYVFVASLSAVMRPTAALQFVPLVVNHLMYIFEIARQKPSRAVLICLRLGATASLVLYASIWLDSWFYGRWTFSAWNFAYVNVLRGVGSFYGTHPWHWYFTQGIPVVFSALLLPVLFGMWQCRKWPLLQITIGFTVITYSLLSHKEFRFIYGIVPLAMVLAGTGMATIWQNLARDDGRRHWLANALLCLLLISNLPLAAYTSLVHQRGTLDVMRLVHTHAMDQIKHHRKPDVLFLMPCHSTPYYRFVSFNLMMMGMIPFILFTLATFI